MRKSFLALLIGSLAIAQAMLVADEGLVAVNTNFEPANRPTDDQAAPPPAPPADQPPPDVSELPPSANVDAEQATREEVVRREEAQIAAHALIDQGQKLYHDGNYEEAAAKFEQALKILPRAPVTEADYNRALRGLTDSYNRLADAAYQAGELSKANQLAQKALEYDPKNRPAETIIVKVKAGPPPPPRPDRTPEFEAKKDQIKHLFREGRILMNSGQYDAAQKRFEQILLLDHYNDDALEYLKKLAELRSENSQIAAETSRKTMLWQVDEAWAPRYAQGGEVPSLGTRTGPISPSVKSAEINQKLNEIIFPEVNFREAVVSDVVKFLSDESRKLDAPTHAGVNIVLGAGVEEGGEAPPEVPPVTPPPAPGATATVRAVGVRKVSLNLRNVPMIDVLKFVTTLANLKYRIESSAVVILPPDAPEGQMVTRTYRITPGVFTPWMVVSNTPSATTRTPPTGGGGGGGVSVAAPPVQTGPSFVLPDLAIAILSSNEVRQAFIDAGVEFPPGSSLLFYERNSTIIVRNTPANLEAFERVLDAFNVVVQQVEIEAKFVEISQNDLDELGFQWKVGNKSAGSFAVNGGNPQTVFESGAANPNASESISSGLRNTAAIQGNAIDSLLAANGFGSAANANDTVATVKGILTNPQFELVIQALAQKKSADVLSAPKVTTISGAQAQIRVAQEFIYPTTFTPPTAVTAGGGNTGNAAVGVTPSTPSAFASRPVGVVFNVTPYVGADGYTINLSLIPQVTDFLGFVNYGSTISLSAGSSVVSTFNDIKQPLFSTRDIMTSVVIWDGQTVVLGGLIREDIQKIDDKIPFLGDIPIAGRLFRTKVTQRTKRNLLIFVTARLIDPAGNPIHRSQP